MKIRLSFLTVLICLLIFSVFMSCRNKKAAPQNVPPASAEEEPLQKITMERTGEPGEEAEIPEEHEPSDEAEKIPSFSGPLFLQQILPQSRIVPDGDYCGPFLDFLATDKEEHGAGALLLNFIQSYKEGRIDERFLFYKRNPLFQEELESFLSHSQEIIGFAAGSFSLSGARASVRMRLYSDEGSIVGVFYLIKTDRQWYVEDWEFPLSRWPGESQSLPEKADQPS